MQKNESICALKREANKTVEKVTQLEIKIEEVEKRATRSDANAKNYRRAEKEKMKAQAEAKKATQELKRAKNKPLRKSGVFLLLSSSSRSSKVGLCVVSSKGPERVFFFDCCQHCSGNHLNLCFLNLCCHSALFPALFVCGFVLGLVDTLVRRLLPLSYVVC